MNKFAVNYSSLETKIHKKAYRLADIKDQLEAVGFDIVRFKDADKGADLWQIQNAEDGDYIVALYQPEELAEKTGDWDVVVSKTAGDLQISYKGDPIVRIAASKLGIPPQELPKLESYLPNSLSSNKKLVKALLSELSPSTKHAILIKYPELV